MVFTYLKIEDEQFFFFFQNHLNKQNKKIPQIFSSKRDGDALERDCDALERDCDASRCQPNRWLEKDDQINALLLNFYQD
jgi:hypothetical protein